MTDRKNQLKMTKIRHSSLDLADSELKKKNPDVLSKARSKLLTLSDALKHRKVEEKQLSKSMTQCTFDYFFKHSQNKDNNGSYRNTGSKATLKKQTSVGPIEIRVSSFDNELDDDQELFYPINRLRPATVCVDSPSVDRRSDAEALALERPRKKLSFKEPEVDSRRQRTSNLGNKVKNGNYSELSKQSNRTVLNSGGDTLKNKAVNGKPIDKPQSKFAFNAHKFSDKILKSQKAGSANNNTSSNKSDCNFTLGKGIQSMGGLGLSVVTNGVRRIPSFENPDLESQAMRVVRTVGQAFEVCHKLQIGAPEDNLDDEQDTTLTQDFLSDRFSDVASDKPKKDAKKNTTKEPLPDKLVPKEATCFDKNSTLFGNINLKNMKAKPDDITSEGANSDKNSLPPDDSSLKDSYLDNSIKRNKPPAHLDILPPPPSNSSNSRKSPLQAETYSAPHSDALGSSTKTGNPSNSLPPPGGALSSHHEIQLLREQLEQQRQQTQAAVAQLQLAREQLQAEQTARMEAQARTHQLLVHNRELLDHIAALVAHLQGGDKSGQQSSPPHMTMPQQQRTQEAQPEQLPQLDPNLVLQALGFSPPGILENRTAANCQSPLRPSFSPSSGTIFNYTYPPSPLQLDTSFETQLLQRIQALGGYPSIPPQQQYGLSLLAQGLYNQAVLNNNYPVQTPNNYNLGATPYATIPRSFANLESRLNSSRHSEPRHLPSVYHQNFAGQNTGQDSIQRTAEENLSHDQFQHYNAQGYGQSINRDQYEKPNFPGPSSQSQYEKPSFPNSSSHNQYEKTNFPRVSSQSHYEKPSFSNSPSQNKGGPQLTVPAMQRRHSSINLAQLQNENLPLKLSSQRLDLSSETRQHRGVSPSPQSILSSHLKDSRETKFIKPLSKASASTAADLESRVRVVVPDSNEEEEDLLTNLRISDDFRFLNGPGISRSASERVPNKSELMSQVQRTMWARHTTK